MKCGSQKVKVKSNLIAAPIKCYPMPCRDISNVIHGLAKKSPGKFR